MNTQKHTSKKQKLMQKRLTHSVSMNCGIKSNSDESFRGIT